MTTYTALVVLHVISAALWFGAPLTMISTLKKGRDQGQDGFKLATAIASKASKLTATGAGLALVTGVGLIFVAYGGFKALPKNFHAAMGLVLVANIIGGAVIGRAVRKLNEGAWQAGWTPDSASAGIKTVAMGMGISHTLWLATLVLMYLRF